jgi:hypothetical protein
MQKCHACCSVLMHLLVKSRLAVELTRNLPTGRFLAQTILAPKGTYFSQHLLRTEQRRFYFLSVLIEPFNIDALRMRDGTIAVIWKLWRQLSFISDFLIRAILIILKNYLRIQQFIFLRQRGSTLVRKTLLSCKENFMVSFLL